MNAAIKFVQGGNVGTAGVALVGVLTTPVVASNGNDDAVGAIRWRWSVIDAPPGSSVLVGTRSDGPKKTLQFVPDVRGGYLLEVIAFDVAGNQHVDQRVFQVAEANGFLVPPFKARGGALNFAGSLNRGWSPIMEKYLRESVEFPTLATGGMFAAASSSQLVQVPGASNGRTLTVSGGVPTWKEPLDPVDLNLGAWFKPNYAGSPWVGSSSAGGSFNRNIAGSPAHAVGSPVNGFVPGDTTGQPTLRYLQSTNFSMSHVMTATAYSWILLIKPTFSNFDGISSPTVGAASNRPIWYDNNRRIGCNQRNTAPFGSGTGLPFYIQTYQTVTPSGSVGIEAQVIDPAAWQLVQVVFNGSTLRMRLNGGSWSSVASAANTAALGVNFLLGGNSGSSYSVCSYLEGLWTVDALTDQQFDDLRLGYFANKYPSISFA